MSNASVHIYTDGAARGNPGPGGYGIVMEWVGKPYKRNFTRAINILPTTGWNFVQ